MSGEQGAGGVMSPARPAAFPARRSSVAPWRRVVDVLDRIAAMLSWLLILIGSTALAVVVPLSGWMVFGRYVLNDTPTWVDPTSLLLLLVITFPVAAAGIRNDGHLSIDFIRDAMPPRVRMVLKLICHLVLAWFGAIMAMSAFTLIEFGWVNRIPLIGLPDGARHIPMAICGACVCLFSLVHVLKIASAAAGRLGDASPDRSDEP
jgi:TRAP-type C4-dicarboxylate transport system permease small subunit